MQQPKVSFAYALQCRRSGRCSRPAMCSLASETRGSQVAFFSAESIISAALALAESGVDPMPEPQFEWEFRQSLCFFELRFWREIMTACTALRPEVIEGPKFKSRPPSRMSEQAMT